jgi:hypothetical protein
MRLIFTMPLRNSTTDFSEKRRLNPAIGEMRCSFGCRLSVLQRMAFCNAGAASAASVVTISGKARARPTSATARNNESPSAVLERPGSPAWRR